MRLICLQQYTVTSEIFSRVLFPRITLKDIFATLQIRDYDMIYNVITSVGGRVISPFCEVFIYTKLCIREV